MITNIAKITTEIAFDNGCVNAVQSLDEILDRLPKFLDNYDMDYLACVECYLSTLDHQEIIELACGTEEQMKEFEEEFTDIYGLDGLNLFLDEIFDEVV